MSLLSINYPLIIEPYRHAKNGLYPDADFYSQAHACLNHIQVYRGAEVFRRSNLLGVTRSSGTNTVWRWRFRSGYAQTQLQVAGIAGLANASASDPAVQVNITKSGGATQTITIYGGDTVATPSDSPSEWTPFQHTFDIDPASVYECTAVTIDYGCFLSLVARTLGDPAIDDATSYLSEYEPAGTHPVYDANIQRLIEGSGNLLRQNRGLGINWCLYNGSSRSRTSSTPINLIDDTSTGNPTATTPGFRFNTTALNTASRTSVPFDVAVYASCNAEGALEVLDTSGTNLATVTISGAAGWYTSTGSLSVSTGTKVDLHYYAEDTDPLIVYAVSLQAWES